MRRAASGKAKSRPASREPVQARTTSGDTTVKRKSREPDTRASGGEPQLREPSAEAPVKAGGRDAKAKHRPVSCEHLGKRRDKLPGRESTGKSKGAKLGSEREPERQQDGKERPAPCVGVKGIKSPRGDGTNASAVEKGKDPPGLKPAGKGKRARLGHDDDGQEVIGKVKIANVQAKESFSNVNCVGEEAYSNSVGKDKPVLKDVDSKPGRNERESRPVVKDVDVKPAGKERESKAVKECKPAGKERSAGKDGDLKAAGKEGASAKEPTPITGEPAAAYCKRTDPVVSPPTDLRSRKESAQGKGKPTCGRTRVLPAIAVRGSRGLHSVNLDCDRATVMIRARSHRNMERRPQHLQVLNSFHQTRIHLPHRVIIPHHPSFPETAIAGQSIWPPNNSMQIYKYQRLREFE